MKYKISIPQPCHEDWNKMTPNEKGRFCDACEKTVIDFSNTSKFHLAKRIHAGENICGRFKSSQLNTTLTYLGPLYRNGAAWALSLVGLFAVSATAIAEPRANKTLTNLEMLQYEVLDKLKLNNKGEENKSEVEQSDSLRLQSTVVDAETKEAISFAVVKLLVDGKFVVVVHTDFDGIFQIECLKTGKEMTVEVSSLNYETMTITLNGEKEALPNKIEMKKDELDCGYLIGEVIIEPAKINNHYLQEQVRKYYR